MPPTALGEGGAKQGDFREWGRFLPSLLKGHLRQDALMPSSEGHCIPPVSMLSTSFSALRAQSGCLGEVTPA